MSDVFISYARSSQEQAKSVEEALRATGYDVWRDSELPAHRAYSEVIEERLQSAKAVVVLWSAEAAKSHWVRAEADAARELGTLVQAKVDETLPPIPFNQIQCADLSDWAGDGDHPGWAKLAMSVAALAGQRGSETKTSRRRSTREICVCVLPFANMSGDVEQEYFSDGISEDITTDLSKISALGVVARNTAFQFKGKSVDVCEVARKLGVTHVLEGSVRKAGERVRITAQLIDGATGDHIWAERYDRDLTDIFAIQDEISKAIVEALKVTLLPEEKKAIEQRGTGNVEAYNLYLMARNYWVTGNHGDPRREERVMRICKRAVELDPNYAQAWALLAIAQSNLRYGFGQPVDDGYAAAHTALAIDPTIAEAHCPMARRLMELGRHDEAMAELEKGLKLDPQSWDLNKAAAFMLFKQSKNREAAERYEKAVAVMETDYHGWGMLLSCYQSLDDPRTEQAARMTLEQSERVLAQDPSNGAAISFAVGALAALGDGGRAKDLIHRALLIDPDNLNMRYNFACALSVLNERDAALDMLESSLLRAKGSLGMAEVDPDLENVRDHPRYKTIIAAAKKRIAKAQADAAEEVANPAAES
ncbi:MAG TPA: TIR domain-containing protein [Sphingomicrobium sp.]|nr:TIR domain-containing protein [Sphingomicrobium sp.]